MPSLRPSDYQAEAAVAAFLDRHFYPKKVLAFQRFGDKEQQFKGIDVQFDFGEQTGLLVDEKAASHYVNKNLPTFAFELDFIGRDGRIQEGWFYDATKYTQYYLLSWIWAKQEKRFSADDITKLEIVLVERRAIIKMLQSYYLSQREVARMAHAIRGKKQIGLSHKENNKPYYFYFTDHLVEKPINIIIRKNKLIELSILHQFITNE